MATGASTADVAILLIDARNGVRTQSKRHARIARLLGISDFVLAINKMDLVDFDQDVYDRILDDFSEFLTGASVHAIPLSALHGDNVITRSERTPYFDGPPLLEYLETVRCTATRPPGRSASPCSSSSGRMTCSAATPGSWCRAPCGPAIASPPGPLAAPPA
jgi:bifunctional enzyme CysN/CysC